MAKLVLSLNGNVLNQYFVDKPVLTIGRDTGNDIVISDPLLSRRHARIISVGEDHIIEDLHSSNGTLVNGSRQTRKILHHRDIIGLGDHCLGYQNTRMSSDFDLERTMLIQALPRDSQPTENNPAVVPAIRSAKAWLAEGEVRVVSCASGQHAADTRLRLARVVTTFGVPGEQLIVLTRRPQGYFLTHVEGKQLPRLNGRTVSAAAHPLHNGDRIEAAGYLLEFLVSSHSAQ